MAVIVTPLEMVVTTRKLLGRVSVGSGAAEEIELGENLYFQGRKLHAKGATGGSGPHTHPISDIDSLQSSLDGKANTSHTHTIAQVTNLQSSLDAKAATTHVHPISDVTNLQSALDGKASTTHSHAISDVTNLQSTLDGKAASSHTHAISDVTNLQSSLDGKAAASHTHTESGLSLSDNTTGNASTSAHGFCPKLSGVPTQYMDGTGGFSTPAGGGGGGDTILLKTGDQQISAAGFVDITGLTFAINNGETFQFDGFIVYQSSATTMGVLFGVNGPTNNLFVARSSKQITVGGTASPDMFSDAILTAYNTPLPNSIAEPALNTNLVWEVRGVIRATANGTVALRFSKENVAGNATVKAGSFLRYRRLT